MSRASAKRSRRADLDQEQHDRAGAGRDHVGELDEVLGAALGDGVGKFGQPRLAHQMHVLDLDIAGRPAGSSSRKSTREFLPYFTSRRIEA